MTVPAPKKDLSNMTDEEIRDMGRLDTSSGITLDQEKFNTVQELVQLGADIGEARQALVDLEAGKSEFLLARENEVMDRILALIERSKDALRRVTENHDQLRAIGADVRELRKRVLDLRDSVVAMARDFMDRAEAMLGDLASREERVNEQNRQNIKDKEKLDAERDQIEFQKTQLKEDERGIADQRTQLERGFAELEAKAKETK